MVAGDDGVWPQTACFVNMQRQRRFVMDRFNFGERLLELG